MKENTKNAYELIKMMFVDDRLAVYVIENWNAVYWGLKKGQLKEYDVYCKMIIEDWEKEGLKNLCVMSSGSKFKLK